MQPDPRTFKHAVIADTLRSCDLFAKLSEVDLDKITAFSALKNLAKGEFLFREGEPTAGFYVVQRGTVSINRVNAAGKEHVIHVFRPGQSFAEAALAGEGGYPADARALEEGAVVMIPRIDFVDLVRRDPELALGMLGSMSQHLRLLVGRIDDLTLKDMETRLANWLIKRCPLPHSGEPVEIELDSTKRVLAAELGSTSETFSRSLAKFRERNLLRVDGNLITVLDPGRLEQVLLEHLGEG